MSDKLLLGAIIGVHGIKGEVKVKSFTQIPEDIDQYGLLEDKSGAKKFDLRVIGQSKGVLRVKIKGVDNRNTSENLIGTELYIDRNLLPELEDEDEFYHTDLIGLCVKTKEGEEIGKVLELHNFGAGDLLEVKLTSGKTELLPFTETFVPEIDINNGIIISDDAIQFLKGEKENEG